MNVHLIAHEFALLDGAEKPYGAVLNDRGCNFSIYCPDAEAVFVCLFDKDEREIARIALTQRVRSNWYGCISNVNAGQLYGYRVKPKAHKNIISSSANKLLIDPYAKQLNRALVWNEEEYEGDSQSMIPKCVVIEDTPITTENEAWNTARAAKTPLQDRQRIVYETHVKGLSMLHPDVPSEQRGTYLGARHPAILEHLKRLGITSVQFLPLMSFMPEPFVQQKGLSNYWGYNPMNFFAPEPRYAIDDAMKECKAMIAAYKESGFEVILDVVYNHTAESGLVGQILSFKGLCARNAYITEQHDETDSVDFLNFSGCGNTVKVWDTYMQTLILDSMRYWVLEMGVNGFRFDLAATLGREQNGFHQQAAIFKMINQDPILSQATLIAEPWDIGPGGYQLGHFPANWMEVNDKFRDCTRAFWRGDKGLKGEFATRFMGSKDIFKKSLRSMHASINNVTYHDGFTLQDLVSYEHKHNESNLENNKDGHNHNLSRNYGVEGSTNKAEIIALREQQKRNLFASLVLSQGTPHILGGDELSRTQQGNNNAYCQDNALNYYDWELSETGVEFLQYCRYVIALRQQHALLQAMHFDDDHYSSECNIVSAEWYRRDGSHKRDIDWENKEHHCFALHIVGKVKGTSAQQWLFVINSADSAKHFVLDVLENSEAWQCVLDTSLVCQEDCAGLPIETECELPPYSMKLFKGVLNIETHT